MSTTAKASDHVKPCNIEQSERHNRRDAEYIASLNPRILYVRTDLSPNNVSYVAPDMQDVSLQQHYDAIKVMVKQKTGRAMQEKKVMMTGKNGKQKERNGSSPIRESVVNIKPDTTMDDLLKYTNKVHKRWGVRAIQIHIHKDEGHYENPDDLSTWKPNLHAHIIWDWMNHETGKSYKLGKKDMEELQDMAANTLEMERGQRKSETGREHLEHNDFILSQQRKQSAELDIEIVEKRDKSLQVRNIQEDVIKNHIIDIRRQAITSILFLPSNSKMPDSIVFLDRIMSVDNSYISREQLNCKRLFSLSDYGFYMLLFKLSVHFSRIQEKVNRGHS